MGVAAAALLTVVSLAGVAPQGAPAQPSRPAARIFGRVVDAASGRPIAGGSSNATDYTDHTDSF